GDAPLVVGLREPVPCELLGDQRCFPAVSMESLLELVMFADAPEALRGADVLRQLAAEVVVEIPPGEAGEEVTSENAEVGWGRQPVQRGPGFVGRIFRTEEARRLAPSYRVQAFDGAELGHLSEVAPGAGALHVGVDRIHESGADVDQRR